MSDQLPTAAEARRKADARNKDHSRGELHRASTAIQAAVSRGAFSVNVDEALGAAAVSALEFQGYKVEQGSHRNEMYCQISW